MADDSLTPHWNTDIIFVGNGNENNNKIEKVRKNRYTILKFFVDKGRDNCGYINNIGKTKNV